MGVYYINGQTPWSPGLGYRGQIEEPPPAPKESRLQKLKRLAERPGTPAEGEAARRFIEKLSGVAD